MVPVEKGWSSVRMGSAHSRRVRFTHKANRRRSGATSPLGWRRGEASYVWLKSNRPSVNVNVFIHTPLTLGLEAHVHQWV